jgi:ComF family protein
MKYARPLQSLTYIRPFVMSIKQQGKNFINLILPPRCAFSGEVVAYPGEISPEAWASLRFIAAPFCGCCGRPFSFEVNGESLCAKCVQDPPEFNASRAPLIYDDYSRSLILKFKHADQMHLVTTFLPWMIRSGEELIRDADILIPVPLHHWRLFKRRYNQAAIIAKALSKAVNVPWNPFILERSKATVSQGFMTSEQREKNVKNAFRIHPKYMDWIKGKNVLLIDDVYTTGATVRECARVLLAAGAARVDVLVLAKVVKGD